MRAITSRLIGAGAGAARSAWGAARSVGRGIGRSIAGLGRAASRIGLPGGSSSRTNGNEVDEEFIGSSDYSNESRSRQLVALNTPIESTSGFSESGSGKGTFDPAVIQILRSIDSNIRSMRDSINMISATNAAARGPASDYRPRRPFQGAYAVTGLGLLGLGAGQVLGGGVGSQRPHENGEPAPGQPHPNPPAGSTINPAEPAPQITGATGSTNDTLQQNLGLTPAPNNDVLSQPPTAQNRTAHIVDIAQLRSAVNQTRESLQANNRNPRQNSVVMRIISDAENNVTELERLYQSQNPDMDAITDLRRQILERLQSARNYITPSVTPQQDNRTLPTPPTATPESTNDAVPGPQSSNETDPSFMQTIINNRMEDYYNSYSGAVSNRDNNNYFSQSDNRMTVNGSRDLTDMDILSGNEDNVAKRLEAIQTKNDATPIIIQSGGGESAPTIIQQSPQRQNNTPAPSPGTGDINIGYKSHPMLINEPRSPAFFSHP